MQEKIDICAEDRKELQNKTCRDLGEIASNICVLDLILKKNKNIYNLFDNACATTECNECFRKFLTLIFCNQNE